MTTIRPATTDAATAEVRRHLRSIAAALWLLAWATVVAVAIGAVMIMRAAVIESDAAREASEARARIEAEARATMQQMQRIKGK